ncbi:class I SAM-dependent methyltransferase [Fischerella thermalis]|uniref:class I SAM-dependent methyltransferase n=1 Tax=Fischerella thermalis TaxID=372787 RepID=UPI00307D63AB
MNLTTVNLGTLQETLLITLWARAVEINQLDPILTDPIAADILTRIDYDFQKLLQEKSSQTAVCIRGKAFDKIVSEFLQKYPQTPVVEIGAGLNTRFERLDNGSLRWFDLDLPDAMTVRKSFFEESDRRQFISASVLETEWIESVNASTDGPILFIAEGVLLYFSEQQVKTLFATLAEQFPGSWIVFDAISRLLLAVRHRFDAVKHTSAKFQWGIWNIQEIETWDSRYQLCRSLYIPGDFNQYLTRFPWMEYVLMKLFPGFQRMSGVHLVKLSSKNKGKEQSQA